MKVTVVSPRSRLAFSTVRQVLLALGCDPDSAVGRAARDLRLYFPLVTRLAEAARSASVSLTDASTPDDQLRYFQSRRLLGNHLRLAVSLAANGPIDVEVLRAESVDEGSLDFFRTAVLCAGWRVDLRSGGGAVPQPPDTPENDQVLGALERAAEPEAQDVLVAAANDCLNVGDARTAMVIVGELQVHDRSARVWNIAALASAMLGRSIEAERFYQLWGASGGEVDRARAMYGQAMLYTRHHPAPLRDPDRSAALLEQGEAILSTCIAREPGRSVAVFDWVFNRNGYALILFRRGQVAEALTMLEDGIARLTVEDPRVAIHRSVLIYNIAQCHMALKDTAAARRAFDRLFEVDPYMPEYRLESARCHGQAGEPERAVAECRRALELDPTMSVAWRLLGLYLARSGRLVEAADAYGTAATYSLSPEGAAADRVQCLVGAGAMTQAAALADELLAQPTLPAPELARTAGLRAEIALRDGDRAEAVRVIDGALERSPWSPALRRNRERLARV